MGRYTDVMKRDNESVFAEFADFDADVTLVYNSISYAGIKMSVEENPELYIDGSYEGILFSVWINKDCYTTFPEPHNVCTVDGISYEIRSVNFPDNITMSVNLITVN